MSSRRPLAALVVVLVGFMPGNARAAAPWSAPQPLGDRGTFVLDLLPLTTGGVALGISTGEFATVSPAPTISEPFGMTAWVSPGGVVGPLTAIRSRFTFDGFMPTTDSRVLAFGQDLGGSRVLASTLGTPGSTFAAPQPIVTGTRQAFAGATAGDAVLVTRCYDLHCDKTDLAVIRRSRGRWSVPHRVTRPGADVRGGAIAVEPDGSLAIAYARRFEVYVRRLTHAGNLTAAQHVGSSAARPGVSLAMGPDHRLVVAWASQAVGESRPLNNFSAVIACSDAAGHFSGRSTRIGSVPLRGVDRYVSGGLRLEADASGRAVVGWTDYAGGRLITKVARVGAGCSVRAQTFALADTDTQLSGLAVSPWGAVTLAMTAGRRGAEAPAPGTIAETQHGIFATHSGGAGERFTVPVQVSAPNDSQDSPVVAIDETSGRSVLMWRNLDGFAQLATAP